MTTPPATRRANRLAHERSPYLLQHAYNPVDWYPWGPEALAKAKQEDKPIFLSIGYSTCYWCHVMEQESFENDTIAQQINASFVPVKVDREERPDLDSVYMSATPPLCRSRSTAKSARISTASTCRRYRRCPAKAAGR